MDKNRLGQTGLTVTSFCLGTLPMGPVQANLSEKVCVRLIQHAIEKGVNFIDTDEMYQTQTYIGKAVEGRREELVIASKSDAADYVEMKTALNKSLRELNTDYIDIYHLHAPREKPDVFENRQGALEYLKQAKEEGKIKAIGISTHNAKVAKASAHRKDIDVVYVLVNKDGFGILEGDTEKMKAAIQECHNNGKGVYAMKVLAGGNLIRRAREAVQWAQNIPGIASISIGIVSREELEYNLSLFGIQEVDPPELNALFKQKKLYIFKNACIGCGNCVDTCPNNALSLVAGKATVDEGKCILCGYCSPVCPQFAIRVT